VEGGRGLSATAPPGRRLTVDDLAGSSRRRRREALVRGAFLACAALSILISGLIVFSLIGKAIVFLSNIHLSQLSAEGWLPRRGEFDIRTIFVGTMLVTGIAMLVAAPLGLGAAIYLSEYARPRARRILKPILELLAGIPSVVMGFFALTLISPKLVQAVFPGSTQFNLAAAGIGVGLLVTPLVASVAEDAMAAVPASLREAAYGLGAKRRTASLRVVFPAAVSGIVASLILGISRAVGETMVVAIAAGASGGALFTLSPLQHGQTMTAAMAALAIGSDQAGGDKAAVSSLFFVGLLLFLMTFALNVVGDRFVRRVRDRY
jgi:phosphate transport system permease protein